MAAVGAIVDDNVLDGHRRRRAELDGEKVEAATDRRVAERIRVAIDTKRGTVWAKLRVHYCTERRVWAGEREHRRDGRRRRR